MIPFAIVTRERQDGKNFEVMMVQIYTEEYFDAAGKVGTLYFDIANSAIVDAASLQPEQRKKMFEQMSDDNPPGDIQSNGYGITTESVPYTEKQKDRIDNMLRSLKMGSSSNAR